MIQVQRVIAELQPGSFLWQEEYPGSQQLRDGPLPQELPYAGRILSSELEIRFFDHGERGLLLSESSQQVGSDAYEASDYSVERVVLDREAYETEPPAGWQLGMVCYRDRRGRVVWTRWLAEKKGKKGGGSA